MDFKATNFTKNRGRRVRLEFNSGLCPVNWSVPVIIINEEESVLGIKFDVMIGFGQINGELLQIQSFTCHEFNGDPELEATVAKFNVATGKVCRNIWRISKVDWNPKI